MEQTRRRIAQAILLPIAVIVLVAGMAAPASAATPMNPRASDRVVERPTSLNW